MIVAWCLGGGLGHLTRIRAWHHTHRGGEPLLIATVSAHAADRRITGPATVVELARPGDRPDPGFLRRRLAALLAGPDVTELVVDAFPAGLMGELDGLPVPGHVAVTHLARLLRWDVYQRRLGDRPPRFDRVHLLEPLDPRHLAWLRARTASVEPTTVADPPPGWPAEAPPIPTPAFDASAGTIVAHSGPVGEVTALLGLALRHRGPVLLAAPTRSRPVPLPDRVVAVDLLPVWPLLPRARLVVTGGGWNSVRQAAGGTRWLAVPFPRALDDQHRRLARLGPVAPEIGADAQAAERTLSRLRSSTSR